MLHAMYHIAKHIMFEEIKRCYHANNAERYNLEDIINSFNNELQRLHISISLVKIIHA
jgi:hypothetical protein